VSECFDRAHGHPRQEERIFTMAKLEEVNLYLKLHDKVVFAWNWYFAVFTTVLTGIAAAHHEKYNFSQHFHCVQWLLTAVVAVFGLMNFIGLFRSYGLLKMAQDELKASEGAVESSRFTDSMVRLISTHKNPWLPLMLAHVAGLLVMWSLIWACQVITILSLIWTTILSLIKTIF
jgi:hypothetical protein